MKHIARKLLVLGVVLVSVGAFLADRYLPMWRDTIFRCDGGGSVELPSGLVVPTNRWLQLGDALQSTALLQIEGTKDRHYLVSVNDNPSRKVLLVTGSGAAPLVVTDIRFSGPKVRREYWVERE